jgi:GNAT superfamily N-acetyltransferase
MSDFQIRPVEKFAEPEFSRLSRQVFAEVQQPSEAFEAVLRDEESRPTPPDPRHAPMFRFGAYEGEALVGWSCGWMKRGDIYYMANSGVLPSHRRRGVYTQLLNAVRDHAVAQGALEIQSQHSVLNSAVLVAKLKAGFHVTGLSQSARMGTLVELTQFLTPGRLALYRTRSLPFVTPEAPEPAT